MADWSQYRHDDAHSGTGDHIGVTTDPFKPWTYDANGAVVSSPAVTDAGGQRSIYFGTYTGPSSAGTVYALNPDGTVRWSTQPLGSTGGYIASPTVEDLDGDGTKEVIIPSLDDATLRVFDATTGTQEWSTPLGTSGQDLIASSPIVADLDASPGKEIVIGGSVSGEDGSLIFVDADGTQLSTIELDGPAWSSPLYKDLDGDGEEELGIATGLPQQISMLFPSAKTGGQSLYGFEQGQDGWAIRWQVAMTGPSLASPTAEDLDGDGVQEVVVGAQGGHLYAVDGSTGEVQANTTGGVGPLVALSSPAIADVDHDGALEVVVGVFDGVQALELVETADGHAFQTDGKISLPQAGPQEDTDPWVGAGIAVQDVDGDGYLDLVASTLPVKIDSQDLLNSDALPGTVFAVNGSELSEPGTVPLFTLPLPDDGGISGPTLADVDGDGYSEILAGEGVPVIGNGSKLHYIEAANPIVEEITIDPEQPTDLDEVRFQAEVTDENTPDDEISFRWTFGDGAESTDPSPTHIYPDDGDYLATLTVTDPSGNAMTRYIPVTVTNVPPSISTPPVHEANELAVTLAATAEDPDGEIGPIRWDFGDGSSGTGASVTHTYPDGGTYKAVAAVTDDDGATSEATTTVHVNRDPTISGPEAAETPEGSPMTLSLPWDDPDGDSLEHVGLEGADGATATLTEGSIEVSWTPSYEIASPEDPEVTLPVTVSVKDAGRPTGTVSHQVAVTVTQVNGPPVIGPPDQTRVFSGEGIVLTGTLSDPDGDSVTVSPLAIPSGASLSTTEEGWALAWTPTDDQAGETIPITLEATDGDTAATATFEVTVEANHPPEITLDAPTTVDPSTSWVDNPIVLDASGTQDPDGDPITQWRWSIEDSLFQEPTVRHRFTGYGPVDVQVAATDARGATGVLTKTVVVDDALTGSIELVDEAQGASQTRHFAVKTSYTDGTPLGEHALNVTVVHEPTGLTTVSKTVRTDAAGITLVRVEGDLGLPTFLPGEHTVTLDAVAPSLEDAAWQDREHLEMTTSFVVPTPGSS